MTTDPHQKGFHPTKTYFSILYFCRNVFAIFGGHKPVYLSAQNCHFVTFKRCNTKCNTKDHGKWGVGKSVRKSWSKFHNENCSFRLYSQIEVIFTNGQFWASFFLFIFVFSIQLKKYKFPMTGFEPHISLYLKQLF